MKERVEGWEVEDAGLKPVLAELLFFLGGNLLLCLKALS